MTSIEHTGSRRSSHATRSPLFLPVAVVLTIWILFGGGAPNGLLVFGTFAVSGSAMLAALTVFGDRAALPRLSGAASAMLLAFCAAPLLQLVPLPPALWQMLPGRELAMATLAAVDRSQDWRPLTLAVEPTLRTLLMTVWLTGLLLALLQLSTTELRRIFVLLLGLGLLNVAIGVVQVLSGNTMLQLYGGLHSPFLNGLFANKNHTGLFIAMTFLIGFAALFGERGWERRRMTLAVPVALVLFVSLIATFSRAGVIFGIMSLGFLTFLAAGKRSSPKVRYMALALPAVGIALFAVIVSTDLVTRALSRFGGVNDDLRWSFWQWSWPLVVAHFPVGGGIGSFTALFPPHEQLAWVKPTFVNHVHSDYIEQLLELGIAAPLLWILVLIALTGPVRAAWAVRDEQAGRLALIGAAMLFLVAVHSAFDYPLRRPAIPATCMVALAALLRINGRDKSRLRPGAGYARRDGADGEEATGASMVRFSTRRGKVA